MSRRAFDLPPLELLVAFEAAARHLSFTRAADEIALTQSAVSRQIQALEGRLGARRSRPGDARPEAQRRAEDRYRHDDSGLRRPLADSAPLELHRRQPGRRRAHLGR